MLSPSDFRDMADVRTQVLAVASFFDRSPDIITVETNGNIPTLRLKDGTCVRGLVSIAKYFSRSSHKNGILEQIPEQEAAIDQWLEYYVTHLNRAVAEKEVDSVMKELNQYLSSRVYLVGESMSLADLLLYYGLHSVFKDLSFFDKQKYLHISRWFDNMQYYPRVRNSFSIIPFQKNVIYPGINH